MDVGVFRIAFPAFNSVSNETIEYWADVAGSFLSESWALNGKTFEHAINLMTAHLLFLNKKIDDGNNATGAVQSATEGSVSVSFTAPPSRDGWEYWLSSTPYGVQLWALLSGLMVGGAYIGGLPERKAVRKVGGVFM